MTAAHTFVISAYGESPYLFPCIESLLEQTSVKTGLSQIILYTSTPNVMIDKVCKRYGISQFQSSLPYSGLGFDWNNALKAVKTDYATIVHQDDIYLKSYGEKIIQALEDEEKLNIVFCDYTEIKADGTLRKRNINLRIKTIGLNLMMFFENKIWQRRIYAFGSYICCPAVSYNLKRLRKVNFKFDEALKMVVDWDAWQRIMNYEGKIKYLPARLMQHRIHTLSETTLRTKDKSREKEEYEMYKKYWPPFIAKILMKIYVQNQASNSLD